MARTKREWRCGSCRATNPITSRACHACGTAPTGRVLDRLSALCPQCDRKIDPHPTRQRRCPHCREVLVVRYYAAGVTVPLSEDEARTFDREKRRANRRVREDTTSKDSAASDWWSLIIVVAVVVVLLMIGVGSVTLLRSGPAAAISAMWRTPWAIVELIGSLLILWFVLIPGLARVGEWFFGSQRSTQGRLLRRQHIPTDVKQAVFERDGGKCVHCGSDDDLQYDHDIPVAKGGGVGVENIQILCGPCNRAKGAAIV